MLRCAADENLNNDIVRVLLRRQPALDVVRVQDSEVAGADDPSVLAWAATQQRLLLTHDIATMTAHARRRVASGLPIPGVIEISRMVPIGRAIDDLLLLAECSLPGEWGHSCPPSRPESKRPGRTSSLGGDEYTPALAGS